MEATYASRFSANCVWHDLANLKCGRDIISFHACFTELARLVGESPDSALYGSRLWDVYCEKMTTKEQHTLSSVIHMARQLGRKPCLRDVMAVLDEENLKHGSAQVAPKPPAAGASTSLAPRPMELDAIASARSKNDQCARCKGYGHWSPACETPRNWKRGDPITGRPPSGSTPSGGKGGKGKL